MVNSAMNTYTLQCHRVTYTFAVLIDECAILYHCKKGFVITFATRIAIVYTVSWGGTGYT